MTGYSVLRPVGALVLILFVATCDDNSSLPQNEPAPAPPPQEPPVFKEIASEVGIDFRNVRPVVDDHFMPEAIGPGAALFDYDNDGDLDIYLVNGFRDTNGELHTGEGSNRLYRQLTPDRFVDVTEATGVGHTGYGMGVAVGDIDNDGFSDLYVTNYGDDCLYRNDGGSAFTDITERSGISVPTWSSSAGFVDYDTDGFLDLFVTQYVDFDPTRSNVDAGGNPEYPSPASFGGTADILYRNKGDGSFTDVSDRAGLSRTPGRGLGVIFVDLNADQLIDMYVANDGEPNFAWINTGSGRFEETAQILGLAVNGFGQPEAGMGIALGDYDLNGTMDFLVTHLVQESNTLYRQTSPGVFEDATARSGLGAVSINYTAFGTAFADLDLDGDLDLLTVNGRVTRALPHSTASVSEHWRHYAEPNQVFLNDGAGRFIELGQRAATFINAVEVSRGLTLGDLDSDGDLDVVVSNANGTVRLYRNEFPRSGNWLIVSAIEPSLKREAFGTIVTVVTADQRIRVPVTPTVSYLSSRDPRAHFGLGQTSQVESIHVLWPDGAQEVFSGGPVNRLVEVHRGDGVNF